MISDGILDSFQKGLGVSFDNRALLQEALTHRSYLKQLKSSEINHNERLEFLGDAVLKLIVSDYIYMQYPNYAEGKLTKIRALYVADNTLFFLAKKIDLGSFLMMSKSEVKLGGRNRPSILANGFEALLGAIYLDQGLVTVKQFFMGVIETHFESIKSECFRLDSKTLLQEYMQKKYRVLPEYRVLKEEGPDHHKEFFVEVELLVHGEIQSFEGRARSKKEAEQLAAYDALKFFECSMALPL